MTYTIHEAKTHFSKLIREAIQGENVLIQRGKKGDVVLKLTLLKNSPFEERLNRFQSRKISKKLQVKVKPSELVKPLPAESWEGW